MSDKDQKGMTSAGKKNNQKSANEATIRKGKVRPGCTECRWHPDVDLWYYRSSKRQRDTRKCESERESENRESERSIGKSRWWG
jgi:hypothetical protein